MSDLENTFGEDFAEQYKQEIAKRREERQKVTDEIKAEVSHLAINEGKFKDGDPTFSITSESDVTHDILLMQLPQLEGKSVFGYTNELDSGAVTCPLDYMGEWMSCLFNDPDELKRMDEGEHYIIIGNMDTWENDQGQVQDQVSPVRGVLGLEEAKELADETVEGEVNDSVPSEDDMTGDSEDESDDDGDGLDGFLSGDDADEEDEPDVEYSDVAGVVETLADKDEVVWDLEEGDERVGKVVQITQKQLEIEGAEDKVEELVLQRIEEENEDEDDSDDSEEDRMF